MSKLPQQILQDAFNLARRKSVEQLLGHLSPEIVNDATTIVENAESQKAVLTVALTSITFKIHNPNQDIRYHQESMANGYAGRKFETKVVTPFLQENFKRYAMSESGWLTRSLEQPHPYDLNYPGHIQNKKLKQAFLDLLDHLEKDKTLAGKLLPLFFALMI